MDLPDLRMRLLMERVARLAGERAGVSKSNSYRFYLHALYSYTRLATRLARSKERNAIRRYSSGACGVFISDTFYNKMELSSTSSVVESSVFFASGCATAPC